MALAQYIEVMVERIKLAELVIGKPQVVQRTQQALHTLALGKPLGQRMALRRLVLDKQVVELVPI